VRAFACAFVRGGRTGVDRTGGATGWVVARLGDLPSRTTTTARGTATRTAATRLTFAQRILDRNECVGVCGFGCIAS